MLFLVKRTWPTGLMALGVLVLLGACLRHFLDNVPPLQLTVPTGFLAVTAFLGLLTSDLLVHGALCLFLGNRYRGRHRELLAVFRGQTPAAMLMGALVAGAGEEPLFRGLSFSLIYAGMAALAFGLLHHIRGSLWPFSLWAAYQSCLLSAALILTGSLIVPMVAHFLHDLSGFVLFRYLNARTD
jgi:membrane protease YdiL (CAAX protease family)